MSGKTIAEVEHVNERLRVVALKRDVEPIMLIPSAQTAIARSANRALSPPTAG